MGIYFREIEAAGDIPAPDTGGRLFVSNHVNALVDPILVLTCAPCPISPVAKSTLWSIPGLRWLLDAAGAVPIVRRRDDPTKGAGANDEVFDRIAAWLAGGGNILIFPEGTSHSAPHLLTVKTGAARMLARAFDRGGRDVSLQAVALEFDERHVFRSRCLLLYGPVHRVADLGLSGDALVEALTDTLQRDLSELLVEGATWPERLLIARVAEMLANDAGDRSLAHWSTIGREVERARKVLRDVDEATVEGIRAAVERYYALLGQEGLTDDQLTPGADPRAPGRAARGAALLLLLPLAIAGVALYWVPYQVPRLVAARAKEPDEISTLKLGAGLVAFPLWAAGLIAAALALLPLPAAAAAAAAALASPFAALAWLDRTPRLRRRIRLASRRARVAELRAARAEALALVQATRAKLGM
jgi:1-acyl-sn-glycerol-3-phosphate acyltransferase